jgi:signal transduction histidine kinase
LAQQLSDVWRRFDSLALRTTIVVLLGIGLVHVASLWTYQQSLTHELEVASEARLADQLVAIKRAVMRAPEADREAVAHELSGGPIEAHWSRSEHAVAGGPGSAEWEGLGRRLREVAPEIAADGLIIGANRRFADDPHLALISMRLADQSWVNVSLVAWNPRVAEGHGTLLSTSLMAGGAIVVSILLVRWLVRPLTAFAAASKDLYRSKTAVPVPERGPYEVRDLAVAFNEMQRRIARLIDDRTQALAAVSHDLKTPITRLRFRIEDLAEGEARSAIAADLDEMEKMLDQTLAYLRGDRAEEEIKPVDVVAMLATIVDDAVDRGQQVTLEGASHAALPGRRLALKRAFANLIENAVKYGEAARIDVSDQARAVVVTIQDRGPGIPPQDIERALAAFVRLEPSRNQESGGFGLGLTIAQAIIEGHAGCLAFTNRPEGGLSVSVTLPKAPAAL